MKIRYTLTAVLMLLAVQAIAQKKMKEYYPDGSLKFEGKYVYTWKQDDFSEVLIQDGPANPYRFKKTKDLKEMGMLKNIMPTKAYDGLCRFYYTGGKKFFEGTYKNGVPEGRFTYWWENGNKMSELYFVNGMADRTWQFWENDGKPRSSFSYKAIPQEALAKIYQDFIFDTDSGRRKDEEEQGVFAFLNRGEILEKSSNAFRSGYSQRLGLFKECCEKDLFKVTLWDGKFIRYKDGRPHFEFYFSNNIPSGNWKLWEGDQLAFECSFQEGKIITAKDYLDNESNNRYERIINQQREDSVLYEMRRNLPPVRAEGAGIAIEPAVDPGVAGTREFFTVVEQMPEFPGGPAGITAFVEKNLVYPKKARQNKIEGRAVAEIVIKEDGHVDTAHIRIAKSLGYGTDQEVIRLMKIMPVWKPGKQNGRPVSTKFMVPVNFKLQ